MPWTARLDKATVAYFKGIATNLDMPYQNLINLYLRDCLLLRATSASRSLARTCLTV